MPANAGGAASGRPGDALFVLGQDLRLTPSVPIRMGQQPMVLTQLAPGSQVVLRVPAAISPPAVVAVPGATVSALPREALTGETTPLRADAVQVMRTPQAP